MTPRPCRCDRVEPGGPFVRGRDCGRCWLWHHSPRHREAWGGDPDDVTPVPSRPDCRHFARHTDADRITLGLPRDRDTGSCGKGYGTAEGHVVCTCFASPSGCRGCPGYEPAAGG